MTSHDMIVVLLAVCLCCSVALVVKAIRSVIASGKRAATFGINSSGTRPTEATVYDKAFVYVNGKILGHAESANVDIERKVGVDMKAERTLRARVVSFIPATGLEFDAVSAITDNAKVELKLRFGVSGATLTSNGRITYASIVSSAKDVSRLEFEFNGEPATFVIPEHPLAEAADAPSKPS